MTNQPVNSTEEARELRRRAEALALRYPVAAFGSTEAPLPEWATERLHELRVHQAELQMQNDELCRIQVELDTSRARYFDLYDLAPVGYFTLSERGLILEANCTGAMLLGIDRTALLNQPVFQFILPADQDLFYISRKRLYETGLRQTVELRMLKPDGTAFWARFDGTIDQDATGKPVARLTLSDISEHRRIESLLHQSLKMDSLAILAGGVAHDMNNVLGAILGLASVHAEIQPQGSSAQRAFATITTACERGSQLIHSLTGFAHRGWVPERMLDLNDLIRTEVRMVLRTTLPHVHLEMDLAEDLGAILGNERALIVTILNLCINGAEAMPHGGALRLRTRNAGEGQVELQVEDTGTGMSPEVLEKALNPFFTTKERGQGMGLSVAHGTMSAHQGELEILSQPGLGTRVLLRFPVCQPKSEEVEVPRPLVAERSTGGRLVLLVDDDELVQRSMKMILEMLGHTVAMASSGEEALARLENGYEPDLVFLDMNMPGLGGAGTLPRLRVIRPSLPVVIATGRPNQTVLDLVKAYPHVSQLPKPFGVQDIRQHLAAVGWK